MSEEKVFFENAEVKVTSARFVTFGKTQALSGVTAVSSHYISPKRTGPIVLAIVGLICFSFSWILAVVLIALGVVWWIMQKTEYFVRLESASGVSDAFSSKDQELITKIVEALNDAIVHRG